MLVDFRNGTVERLQTGDKHWLEIFSLCHDDDGKLWIGSSDGVIIMDRDRSIMRYEPGVMPDNNIRSLFKDSSGGIWIGTEYVGAMYWNKQRDKFKPYADDRFHMQDKIITTLNQDENGTFWVGTRNDGLYRFADGQKSVRHFPMDNIRTLYATKDGKKAYVGGEVLGLHEIDIESGRIRKLHSPLDIMCIIPADNGKLWLGTLIGLYLYDIGTDTPVKMDLKHSGPEKLTRILSLFMDKDKNLWIGAKESLSKYTIRYRRIQIHQHRTDPVHLTVERRENMDWNRRRTGLHRRTERARKVFAPRRIPEQHDTRHRGRPQGEPVDQFR